MKMDQVIAGTSRAKLLGLMLMLITSILIVLFSIQIIFHLVVLLYPAYMSVKAVQSAHRETEKRWLSYWAVYSLVHLVEPFFSVLVWMLPFYSLTKTVFLLWCLAPLKQNGATITYRMILKPVLKDYFKP
eukprot:GFUD01024168.1.p1 GENE.GFUD01024168.1~~GFUD01024168.1.p1  ORF type:complete len:130 (-),score=19.92 GFUD01024168.1:77-466(-)